MPETNVCRSPRVSKGLTSNASVMPKPQQELRLPHRFLVTVLLFASSLGCAPSSPGSGQASGSQELPPLTKEVIDERINDARVYEVMPESGTGEPIPWSFDEDEPKEIVVVDQKMEGAQATIILDIKTESSPRAKNMRHLAGQIRTDWRLDTGWVLRRWEIVNTENISMKYRDLPKPTPSNSNRP